MPEFGMCLMQYIAKDHCTNYREVIESEAYLEYCQTFKMDCFEKRIMPEYRCDFERHFVKNTKKVPQGNILEFFFLDTLKIAF